MAPQRVVRKDYYRVLGVPESASAKEIKSAYRELSRQYHPDANEGDAAAEERFKEVSAAYDVVGNDGRRKEYDEVRRLGPAAAGFPGGGGPGGFSFQDAATSATCWEALFGRGGRGGGGAGAARSAPWQDLETELHLTFDDAVAGLTTAVHLTSDAPCHTCNGSGARAGHQPPALHELWWTGRGVRQPGPVLLLVAVPGVRRAWRHDRRSVSDVSWLGRRAPTAEVKVRIPPGVADGQRIRLKGRGGPGQNGGPPGDLYVVVRVSSHAIFARKGNDLTVTVPITFPEATLGADIAVPTLDAGAVTVRIPPGTRSGRTFRVKGKGVATAKGAGDLLATVEVAVPAKLSARRAQGARGLPSRIERGLAPRAPGGLMSDLTPKSRAVYVISVAAELAGLHPQTLRIYERKGLVDPARTGGGSRRYSDEDIAQLRRIQELTDEGLNLAGVQKVLELEAELAALRSDLEHAHEAGAAAVASTHRQYRRDLVPLKQSLTIFRDR